MTKTEDRKLTPPTTTPDVLDAVRRACRTIAPSWPLDRWIAVNPFWGMRGEDVERALLDLAVTSGVPTTMPRSWFRQQWMAGTFARRHVEAAVRLAEQGADAVSTAAVEEVLGLDDEPATRVQLLTDLADARRPADEPLPWSGAVVDQISRHLAAWADRGQASWGASRDGGLYAAWRAHLAGDRGLPERGEQGLFARLAADLPADPNAVIFMAAQRLGLDAASLEDYLVALLATVRGWASWCAYLSWEKDLAGRPVPTQDAPLLHLLAARVAWELLLLDAHDLRPHLAEWRMRLAALPRERAQRRRHQRIDWLLQHALELALQEQLAGVIGAPRPQPKAPPRVEAVFCIDVRSERFRRALERAGGDHVRTRGFAGFFGLPIAVQQLGASDAPRPHLPGLLPHSIVAAQRDASPIHGSLAHRRSERLASAGVWRRFRLAAPSTFPFVEALGLTYLPKLLRGDPGTPQRDDAAGLRAHEAAAVRPTWPTHGAGASTAERVATAGRVLRSMGLTERFAPLVLLAGHGSTSTNNPQAAGLDCGACGGQRGEANARLLAELLNDHAVRDGLGAQGIEIPATTWFVAGLHDTTTDEVRLFDDDAPATHAVALQELRNLLDEAGEYTRDERAPTLGLDALRQRPTALRAALHRRGRDWAQTRPEWGLADNAAFVVGPRALTRGLHLDGRAFLHDYDWQRDDGFATLELILTAPMLVTNWINMQYYASTVAPDDYGSGNKLLHNVVGGNVGVLEGNGGDLRIGLAHQSVHDGDGPRHTPLRLSVMVAAPREAIDDVLARHEAPRSLVQNRWLHLLRVTDDRRVELRLADGGWRALDDVLPPAELPESPPATRRAEPPRPARRRPGARQAAFPWRSLLPVLAVAIGVALRSIWV